jgi:hypothetical protein
MQVGEKSYAGIWCQDQSVYDAGVITTESE